MRRRLGSWFLALVVVSTGLTAGSSPAAAATAPASFVFSGAGFGHGVGMSQYGAYGQALEGRSATQILQHYYTGTTVSPIADNVDIRVNLVHASATAAATAESIGSGGGGFQVVPKDQAPVDGAPADTFEFSVSGTGIAVTKNGTPVGTAATLVTLLWSGTPTLLNLADSKAGLASDGHRYRYGLVEISVVDGKLEVVNVLKFHGEYLRGIAEVPSSWPKAALESQAIAARTYAFSKHKNGVRASCACHVFDTVADQVFAGWSKESGAGGANWVAAVEATSPSPTTGLVVLRDGALVTTYYFSSSGGRTENNEDGFGGTPQAYLRSVDDHWSLNSYNPRRSWSFTKDQAAVAAAFGLPDVVSIDLSQRTEGGAVKTATATSTSGTKSTISGNTLRSKLSLPGAWIRKPVLRLAGGDRYATAVEVGKVAAPDATTVVVASGAAANLVDGLVAAPLAGFRNAPLLLSAPAGLPTVVGDEVARRKATTALLVGGEAALGPKVVEDLRSRGVTSVRRLAGADRYATGLEVAREMGGVREQAVIASGDAGHLVDALAAGGPAADLAWPILLVSRDAVPEATRTALTERGVQRTAVIGGVGAISDEVTRQLPSPTRYAGADRYATAVAVADNFRGLVGVEAVAVASGADVNLVDALAGGALQELIVLTAPTSLPESTKGWLRASPDVGTVHVLGGTSAVSDATLQAIKSTVGG